MLNLSSKRRAVAIVIFALSCGEAGMTNLQTAAGEADRLFNTLNAENVRPDLLESGFPDFSDDSKNAVAKRVAQTFEPPPSGKLLARLQFILTAQNRSDVTAAFVFNLRSPDPAARKFSLYGLEKLRHPATGDFALLLLRDTDDQVSYAACFILFPQAKQNARLWNTLRNLYAARKGKPEFYLSTGFLQDQGIERSAPATK